ncbi:MAG: murein transglycosylase A [Steroidobacteraceae bacterium]
MMTRCVVLFLALVGYAVLLGCVSPPRTAPGRPSAPTTSYEHGRWSELPGWGTDNVQEAWQAFLESCRTLRFRAQWGAPCTAAQTVTAGSSASVRAYFESYFEPYKIVKRTGTMRAQTGLITGYFEPLLHGSRTASTQFMAPLYAPPPDLLIVDLASLYPELKGKRVRGRLEGHKVVPYYTREQLAMDPVIRGNEIVWIDNAFDALMLEVQGSGRVQLPDGKVIRLQYADQNGQPYHSIGRYLVQRGALTLEQATLPGIRAWLLAHPERLHEVLDANPSVVFFTEAPLGDPNLGPKGAEGIALTTGRSIAVDPTWVPLGTPVFLATTLPDSNLPLQRLVIAQDTGGAISGAPRADFFCGGGPQAADQAGKMRQQGSLWILWPRSVPLPGPAAAGG